MGRHTGHATRRRGALVAVAVLVGAGACSSAGTPRSGPATVRATLAPGPTTQAPVRPAAAASQAGAARVWVLTGTPVSGGPARTSSLVPVDAATGAAGRPVALPVQAAFVAVNRAGTVAYLIRQDAPGHLLPVDLRTGTAAAEIALPVSPDGGIITSVAFSPDDRTGYFVDAGGGQLDPVDLAAGTAEAPIPLGPLAACGDVETEAVATPDGKGVYVEGPSGLFDVDLATRRSSPSFDITAHEASGAYGNMAISLDPAGRRLYVLQSGMQADTLVPIDTNGDAALSAISVPIGPRARSTANAGDITAPAWDKIFVASGATADVIEFGSVPEQIVPVALPSGQVGPPVTLSPVAGLSGCGDQSPVPLAILPGGAAAVAAGPLRTDVHRVDLATGRAGPAVPTGGPSVLGVLSGGGWPAFWPS